MACAIRRTSCPPTRRLVKCSTNVCAVGPPTRYPSASSRARSASSTSRLAANPQLAAMSLAFILLGRRGAAVLVLGRGVDRRRAQETELVVDVVDVVGGGARGDDGDGGSRREETVGVADGAVERVLADAEVPGEVVHPRDQRRTRHRVNGARRRPVPGVCLHGPEAGVDVVVIVAIVVIAS